MFDQPNVPSSVKIAWARPALRRAKLDYMHVVAAFGLGDGVERLVQIGDEVDEKFQCFYSITAGCVMIRQHTLEYLDAINNAVAVIAYCRRKFPVRVIAVAPLVKSARIPRNVDEVPTVGFPPLAPNFIGPCGNRSQIVIPQKL